MTQFQCVACALPPSRTPSVVHQIITRANEVRTENVCEFKFVYVSNARITVIIIIDFDA